MSRVTQPDDDDEESHTWDTPDSIVHKEVIVSRKSICIQKEYLSFNKSYCTVIYFTIWSDIRLDHI